MRLSLGSVGALTAALLVAFAFWPENRAVRCPERIVAQDKPKAVQRPREAAPAGKRSMSGNRAGGSRPQPERPAVAVDAVPVDHPLSSDLVRSKAEARIAEVLDQAVDFSIEPQSLKDALNFIATRYQIPILPDTKALEDASVDLSTEVSLNAPGISLRDSLQLILSQLSSPLGYDMVHGVLMISTADKIKEHLETIVYDCRDLINIHTLETTAVADQRPVEAGGQRMFQFGGGAAAGGTPGQPAAKKEPSEKTANGPWTKFPFIKMVVSATGEEFWEEGPSISELGGLLIVRQNPPMHERIKALLSSIRLMRKEGAFAGLANQFDAEAKRHATEQTVLTERLSRLERELQQFRSDRPTPVRSGTTTEPTR